MSFTYLNDPNKRDIDAVRLELGDTLEQTHLIEDEEIQYCLKQAGGKVLSAAAHGADAIAARFSREETVRFSGSTVDKADVQKRYMELARTLRRRAASPKQFILNTASSARHQRNERNTSSTHGAFRRDMFGDFGPPAGESETS